MRGMILAAGRGLRMGALTDHTPKPLLRVGKHFLIEYSIHAMVAAGIKDIVINVSYHYEKMIAALGDGKKYGVNIHYSIEEEALETGGGIFKALPLLGSEPFIVLSSDVISDYDLQQLPTKLQGLGHVILVDNPEFNLQGDFNLEKGRVNCDVPCQLTYANIGLFHPELFAACQPGKFKLGAVLKDNAKLGLITGDYFRRFWCNLGSPEQLASLDRSDAALFSRVVVKG